VISSLDDRSGSDEYSGSNDSLLWLDEGKALAILGLEDRVAGGTRTIVGAVAGVVGGVGRGKARPSRPSLETGVGAGWRASVTTS
jgi:hypothetical protein